MCEHKLKWKDGFTKLGNVAKIEICELCGEITDCVIKELKPQPKEVKQSVWDLKDLRMARENSLRHATALSIYLNYGMSVVDKTIEIAERLEKWIYRE